METLIGAVKNTTKGETSLKGQSEEVSSSTECPGSLAGGDSLAVTGRSPSCSSLPSISRIGRPCNNMAKPSIPKQNSPGVMTSAYFLRKAADDFAAKRISGTSAFSESSRRSSTDDLGRKKSCDGSISGGSIGDRRRSDSLSRRGSDIGVVLTRDTDGFIIGDRVWVGGTKAGHIAYIGETQFAPGEWAGVVLDEPIGKNDGSVANVRYFQCEPKRGIFSRLTRLTRYPIPEGTDVTLPRTPISDVGKSTESLLGKTPVKRSPSISTPKSIFPKPSSPDSAIHPNISVGDRVIVMSSQGSKAGVLRFMGATDFAPGEWCGVELDDPLGKNDGSVAGTRYFECRSKYGLFAPVHKVSKSPASRRPSSQASCQIHRGGAGIRRHGSKESLTSASSIASTAASIRSSARKIGVRTPTTPTSTKNALQEVIKEKELHIEQLLKERDLERAEVTRAASQADEAEKRLATLKQEREQQKEEWEAKVADLDALVHLLKSENEEIAGQLEEEKKKVEDVQFRFEEESIEKGDLKVTVTNLEEKLAALEKNLADERKRVEVLELDSNKLFEAEEQLVMAKDENDSLKEAAAAYEISRSVMEQERIALEAKMTALRAEMEMLNIENQALKVNASQEHSTLQETLSATLKLVEDSKKETASKEAQLQALKMEMEKQEATHLSKEQELGEQHSAALKDVQEQHRIRESELESRISELQLRSELETKEVQEKLKEREKFCQELESQVLNANEKLSKLKEELSNERDDWRMKEENLREELSKGEEVKAEQTRRLEEEVMKSGNLEKIAEELRKVLKESKDFLEGVNKSNEEKVSALNRVINSQKEEIERLAGEANGATEKLNKLKESLDASKEAQQIRLKDLEVSVHDKGSEIEKLLKQMDALRMESESDKEKLKKALQAAEKKSEFEFSRFKQEKLEREREVAERKEAESKSHLMEVEQLKKKVEQKSREMEEKVKDLFKVQSELEEKLKAAEEEMVRFRESSKEKEEGLAAENQKLQEIVVSMKEEQKKIREECRVKAEESNKLRTEMENLESGLKESNEKLSKTLQDLAEIGRQREEAMKKNTELENKVENLEKVVPENSELKCRLSKTMEEKVSAIAEVSRTAETVKQLQIQLETAQSLLKEEQIKNVTKEQATEILRAELESSKKAETAEVTEKDCGLKSLKDELEKLKASLKEAEEGRKTISEIQQQSIKDLVKERGVVAEREEKLKEVEKLMEGVGEELQEEKRKNEEMRKLLDEAVMEKNKLTAALQEQQKTNTELTEKSKKGVAALTEMRSKLGDSLGVQKRMEDSEKRVIEQENTIRNLMNQIETLRKEKANESNNNRILLDSLQKEKTNLVKKMEEMKEGESKIGKETGGLSEKEIEEREFNQGQVDFLNSVIVDMQKKNDALKARIEILEMGFSPEDVQEFALENLKRAPVAPRLFCDICDVFDLHDTEDCPTQAMDPDEPPKSCKSKVPPPQRPYCETCEVFGHDTSECDDAETF